LKLLKLIKKKSEMEKLLTLREVAKILQVTVRTVYTKVQCGDLQALNIGTLRVRQSDLEDYLDRSATNPTRKPTNRRGTRALDKALKEC
jgi:excisionase family DNA binding protein